MAEDKLGTAVIPIRATMDGLDKDLAAARTKVDKGVTGISETFGKIGLPALTAGAAVAGFTKFLKDSVGMAQEAEAIQADLSAVLKSTQGAAGLTADEINKMATAFQNVTGVEDDAIVKGQAMLLTFTKIGRDIFPDATEAALDMSRKFGMALPQAAITLGKALNDPIAGVGALRRIGVMLTDEQEEQIKSFMAVGDVISAQKIILGELKTEIGGVARAYGETTPGQMDIFNAKLANTQEAIGTGMLPVLSTLLEKVSALTAPFTTNNEQLSKFSEYAATLAATPLLAMLDNAAIATAALNVPLAELNKLFDNLGLKVGAGNEQLNIMALAFKTVGDAITIITGGPLVWLTEALKGIKKLWDEIAELFREVTKGDFSKFTAEWGNIRKVLGFQSGGIVPGPLGAPRMALVHGGETIIPVGGTLNVAFSGNVPGWADENRVAEIVYRSMADIFGQSQSRVRR